MVGEVGDLRRRVARLFTEARKRLEILEGRSFRSEAYRKGAEAVLGLPDDELLHHPEQYQRVRGIGTALARKIEDIVRTGTFTALERLRKEVPDGVLELLNVRGVGPSAARQLWKERGIASLEQLLTACEEGSLAELKGWTPRRIRQVCNAARWYAEQRSLRLWADVESEAEMLIQLLRDAYIAERVEPAGDYRRRMPVIDGLDILFVTSDPQSVLTYLSNCGLFEGEHPPFRTPSGLKVRCHFTNPSEMGSRWIEATGSADFVAMLPSPLPLETTEAAVFQAMGWPCVVPEMREGCYSADFLKHFPYEQLIAENDIRGLIHVHTTWSDGVHSLEEIVRGAQAKGYDYVAICDHSQASRVAGGLDVGRFREQWEEIARIQARFPGIRILRGVEVDILNDGSLDLPDDFLAEFDVVVASVHQQLEMDEPTATRRVLKAIESGKVHILGHPTGRLLTRRPGYPLDFGRIFEAAAAHRVAIEINGNPYRLDLDWTLIRQAVDAGCFFSINPDAHRVEDFDYVRHGVFAARKGALLRERVLNARSVDEFLAFWR